MNPTDSPYRFHAFDVSYFSGKVRPALRYKQLWYEERRADLREIVRRTGLGFIPMLVTPEDETWQDSSEIYDRLEARHPEPPLFPRTPLQLIAAHLIELYTDEFALIPAMHYRWGSELGESSARSRFGAMIGSRELGNKAADRMVTARFAVGASAEAAPVIEAHTRELLDALEAHFAAHPYLLGGRMCFADCAMMGPLYAHFFVDLVSRRLLLDTAIGVVGYIERCNAPGADAQGDWLADDELAPTLCELLRVMGRDAAAPILACVREVEAWADSRPADLEDVPRAVGEAKWTMRGTPMKRFAGPYSLWMLQRSLDAFAALEPADRARVDAALEGSGWDEVLAYQPRHRLVKRGFALGFE